MAIREIRKEEGLKFKPYCNLLLVTSTAVQRNELLKEIRPIHGHQFVYAMWTLECKYFIGTFGQYGAVVIYAGKGQAKTTAAVNDAILRWDLKAILLLGTAFGTDRRKQQFGDILVSDKVIFYGVKEEGKNRTYLAEQPAAGFQLKNRFEDAMDWKFPLSKGIPAKFTLCAMLSGEVSIGAKKFRDELLKDFRDVKGGDMEATGVYHAANRKKIDWIIVKGISNFADGEKERDHRSYQILATRSSISLAKHVFSSVFAFQDLRLTLSELCKVPIPKQSKTDIKSGKEKPARNQSNERINQPLPKAPISSLQRMVFVNKRGITGYRDEHKKLIIPCQFAEGKEFCEGLALVKISLPEEERMKFIIQGKGRQMKMEEIRIELRKLGKWGFIDTEGRMVIKAEFERAYSFKSGKAKVRKDGEIFYINHRGEKS